MGNKEETGTAFPHDYTAWQAEWRTWQANEAPGFVRPATPVESSGKFPGINFMADEVLGFFVATHDDAGTKWGDVLELSTVTFLDCRSVGLTWYRAGIGRVADMAHTWEELASKLRAGVPTDG